MNDMNEESKANEDDWSVEPPKKDRRRKMALRVAFIVAALGAVALVGAALIVVNSIEKQLRTPVGGLIISNPDKAKLVVETVDNNSGTDCASDVCDPISDYDE